LHGSFRLLKISGRAIAKRTGFLPDLAYTRVFGEACNIALRKKVVSFLEDLGMWRWPCSLRDV